MKNTTRLIDIAKDERYPDYAVDEAPPDTVKHAKRVDTAARAAGVWPL